MTYTELSKALGCTPATLRKWRAMPDAPKSKNVDAWRQWIDNRAPSQGRATQGESATMAELRAELIRAQTAREQANARLRQLEIEQREKNLVPETTAINQIKRTLGPLRQILNSLPRAVAAQCNPENPMLAEVELRRALDEKIFSEMVKILEATEPDQN